MKARIFHTMLLGCLAVTFTAGAQPKALRQAAQQYRYLMQQLPPERFPVTWYQQPDKLMTTGSEPWVGGFYPGALLYLYEAVKDTALLGEALRKMQVLEKEKFNKTTHDLGFMMYCSFGNAYRILGDTAYRSVVVESARSLASRFSPVTGVIKSWDTGPKQFMVIIDNMMNLEMLFAATRMTGDSSFYHIAVKHANTTLQHHFRPDFSSHHLVIYDPVNGSVQKKQTVQGLADSSSWARGQAWGLYGYTMMYRETRDPAYLRQARGIADYMLRYLPGDYVFRWDFHAPEGAPRDVSAAAITASALFELSEYAGKRYRKTAEKILRSLSSPAYFAQPGENGGFLLKHGVGNFPRNADIDVPLIYADYYFVEAWMRSAGLSNPPYHAQH